LFGLNNHDFSAEQIGSLGGSGLRDFISKGFVHRSLLQLCYSREGGNPGRDIFSGHPPARVWRS